MIKESLFDQRNNYESASLPAYNRDGEEGEAMVRHIDSELQSLKDLALQMGGCVEKALENACLTIASHDAKAYEEVGRHEARINDLQILID